ncbi:hypothetical protein NLI96_g3292 [Meripilus lineatus]|uniref:Small ribosomal subunit protein uS5m n=1 Tax=Meripilus lineatus TaxID=2056292 RepID=A0AAD5V8G1_9APHY|nr:hypothetical protein NLI96_g3292 [Physisporinus lineatus]
MSSLTRRAATQALRISRTSSPLHLCTSSQPALTRSSSSNVPSQNTAQSGFDEDSEFPNLMVPDPLMDLYESETFPPTRRFPYESKVIVRNDPSMFDAYHDILRAKGNIDTAKLDRELADEEVETNPMKFLPISSTEVSSLYRYPLIRRMVTQQTGKGKIKRYAYLTVVGNGNGLVGYGEGKDYDVGKAANKSFLEAVRNMDYVERFEQRTIWTEMESKLGATKIILRPRPVGFGLHTNPNIHQVLKAAGIKDASAKVWGSRNPLNVIKLLFRMLHAGNAPLAMGDGIGGGAKKLDRGVGMRGVEDLERERGRKLLNLRTH